MIAWIQTAWQFVVDHPRWFFIGLLFIVLFGKGIVEKFFAAIRGER